MPARYERPMEYVKDRWLKTIIWAPTDSSNTQTVARVYLHEIQIDNSVTVDGIRLHNFSTVAGNVTIGIYGPITIEDTPEGSSLVATTGSVAMNGANVAQFFPLISNVTLTIGKYYIGVEASDATATFGTVGTNGAELGGEECYYDRGGGYGALTDPCPVTTISTARVHWLLVRCVSKL